MEVEHARALGCLTVPILITGMWQVAGGHGRIDHRRAVQEMTKYADAGLGTFDMADIYGPAEEMYGKFRQNYSGTKVVQGFTKFVPRPGSPATKSFVEGRINRSKQQMGVNCLDLVQLHWWDYNDERYLDVARFLFDLRNDGSIREIALTNFDTRHMSKIVESGVKLVSNQVAYSIIDRRPEKEMVSWCLNHDVKLLAYGTLLGGFFSEKYVGRSEPSKEELTTSSLAKYKYTIDKWGGWQLFQELLLALQRIASRHGVSISTVAMRYIVDKPAVCSVIIGARLTIAEHIADNLRVFQFTGLDHQDRELIESVVDRGNPLPGDCGDEYR